MCTYISVQRISLDTQLENEIQKVKVLKLLLLKSDKIHLAFLLSNYNYKINTDTVSTSYAKDKDVAKCSNSPQNHD